MQLEDSATMTKTTILIRAQKLYSANINAKKEKLLRKRAQPLRNSKLIELSGWAKRKNLQIPYIKIELRTRFTIHTHTHTQK